MNVGCLVPYPLDHAPSQRFRVEQWTKQLAQRGIHVDYLPFFDAETMGILYRAHNVGRKVRSVLSGTAERIHWVVRRATQYDVVVVHREALPFGVDWFERYLARSVPTVYDLDDAVWMPNVSAANKRVAFLKGFGKINRIMGMVSAVSAGCNYLADHARQFNRNVFVVPTSIDLDQYGPPRDHVASEVLTIGWTGSVTSAQYLEPLRPVLQHAAKVMPLRLRVIGTKFELPGVDVVSEDWTAAREIPFIRTFDVGIKPIAHDDWVRGKCPMKDIQYMALGVPPIATRFGTALESIEHGVSGYLCDTTDDWLAAFEALRSKDERVRIGAAAREVVEKRYSAVVAAGIFALALESAVEQFHSSRESRSLRRG